MNDNGEIREGATPPDIDEEAAVRMYKGGTYIQTIFQMEKITAAFSIRYF
jgi:hypothetical protein